MVVAIITPAFLLLAALNGKDTQAPPPPPTTVNVEVDLVSSHSQPFPHYWERCVGSGHGALTLREDWRKHVAMAHRDLGIERVRFHGILDDDMSVSFAQNETGFANVDSTCDFLIANNMSMVMELGFMPRWLARNKTGTSPAGGDGPYSCRNSINHYVGCSDPPYDFDLWGDLIYTLGKHMVDRYGIEEMATRWSFEVWNEPGLHKGVKACQYAGDPTCGGDWWGSTEEYYHLYSQAARNLKAVDQRLQVGGPAIAGCSGTCPEVRMFVDWCENNATGLVPGSIQLNGTVPIDFITTHTYAGGETNVNNAASIVDHLSSVKPIATEKQLYHIMTEWGGSYANGAGTGAGVGHGVGGTANYNYNTKASWRGSQQDTHETAAFILAVIRKSQDAGFKWGEREATSYWDISDVFEEGGFAFANNSFNGNFGLVNVHGVPKPAYRAFQLLHEMGTDLLASSVAGGGGGGSTATPDPGSCASTVGVLASKSNNSVLSILLFSQATLGAPVAASCTANVTVRAGSDFGWGAGSEGVVHGSVRRIDAAHTAPKATWLQLGMPQWPTAEENAQIFDASIMRKEKVQIKYKQHGDGGGNGNGAATGLHFVVDIPANSVVAVQVPIDGSDDVIAALLQQDQLVALADAERRLRAATEEVAELKRLLKGGKPAAD